MPSEAKEYWQYSQECIKQALHEETQGLRDELLSLARMWTEAALCEELKAKRSAPKSNLRSISAHRRNLNSEGSSRDTCSPATKFSVRAGRN